MTPTYVVCEASCTVALQFEFPPFNLTPEDGGLIAMAIIGVWAVALGFRALIMATRVADTPAPSDSSD